MAVEIAPKLFRNAKVSQLYQECRPRYAESGLMEKILKFMRDSPEPAYEKAADIGCGTGLSTEILAPHFMDVVGMDASYSQIEEAKRGNTAKNVTFCIGSAEDLSRFPDDSLDLLTVGTAIHYFKIDDFYRELDRILKPGGTFAQFGYNNRYVSSQNVGISICGYEDHPAYKEVSKECNDIFMEIFATLLSVDGYQPAMEREMYGVEPPKEYIDQERYIDMTGEWSHPCKLSTLMGLLQSLGVWQHYCTNSGIDSDELAGRYKQRFLKALMMISDKPEEVPLIQHLTFFVVLARKPYA